ncbi:MAG: glycosyl hydrolase, partial [Verrucomicrobiota bacterium]
MLRILAISLTAPLGLLAEPLVVNGDFEAIDESGWDYRGENDGSRGVYSDPTRLGTHTYLLELAGGAESGVSAISQIVSVEPGDTYQLSFDLFSSCDRDSATGAQHFVNVGDESAFVRNLGEGTYGWVQRRILFQPRDAELKIEFGVRGRNVTREESTTAIDNVRLVRVEPIEFAESLKRGRPFAPVLSREQLPIAIQMSQAGWGGLQAYRNCGAPNPAMASVDMHFDLGNEPFDETGAALEPWIRQGITPILTANLRFDQLEAIIAGEHDAVFRTWANEAYDWGYPILFRPWAKMDVEEGIDRKQFIQAWRRARAQFDDAGAENVLWIWSPTELTGDSEKLYPGDDSVDIVACSIDAKAGFEALVATYAYHGSHYKNNALGFLDLEADNEAFLDSLFTQTAIEFPRLEFMG